ncbi:unnamed protein product [Cuscuta campestris]|uniref:Uncharacterized protein n=1 Tax=Cuscuta campestris TaxID=132261 RepID=A0A484N571_9ASTE|nr:unnamed protein product [Cuscuta campestris]
MRELRKRFLQVWSNSQFVRVGIARGTFRRSLRRCANRGNVSCSTNCGLSGLTICVEGGEASPSGGIVAATVGDGAISLASYSREQYADMVFDGVGPSRFNSIVEEEPNPSDKKFIEMLKAADTDLWKGYDNGNDDSQSSWIPTLERLRRNLFGDWRISGVGSSRADSSDAGSSRVPILSPSLSLGALNSSRRSSTPLTETSATTGARMLEEEHREEDQHEEEHNEEGVDEANQHEDDQLEGNKYVYVNLDDDIVITRDGAAKITLAFSLKTDPAGKTWKDVSHSYRDFYYWEFKKRVKWNPTIDEEKMKDVFFSRAAGLYSGYMYNQRTDGWLKKKMVEVATLESLKEGWSGPEFQETSKRKKKNRRRGKEDGPALGTYTGGTIPFSENYNRLAAKKGAPISVEEVIVHTKTKKHDGQTWVDPIDADLG